VQKSFERARTFLASALIGLNRNEEALPPLREALPRIERGMSLDPDDLDWPRLWLVCKIGLDLPALLRPADRAGRAAQLAAWRQALAVGEKLAKKDPHNRILQADLASVETVLAAVHYKQGNAGDDPAAAFTEAVRLQGSAVRRLEALARADPSNAEWAHGLKEGRKILGVLEMRQAGATAPKLPGLTDPEYLQVARSEVGKKRQKHADAPTAANAEALATDCLTLAGLLAKGDYGPYLDEARKVLAEGRDALKKAGEKDGLNESQKFLLAEVEKELQALAGRKGRGP
jgi:hypothetical protein